MKVTASLSVPSVELCARTGFSLYSAHIRRAEPALLGVVAEVRDGSEVGCLTMTLQEVIEVIDIVKGGTPMVTEITDNDFEDQVVKSEVPALVDFYAPWCGPCRMISPVVEKLSKEYDGKFRFCKLNVDQNPQMAIKYGVMSIPLLLFFKGGEQVDDVRGAVPEEVLRRKVAALL